MSATDELRRMLDEHGVKWTKPKSATEFMQTTFLCGGWGIEVLERNIGLCVTATNVFDTPDQAVAATLGGFADGGMVPGSYIRPLEEGSICPVPRTSVIFEGQKLTFDSEDSAKFSQLVKGHLRKLAGLRGDA